mmetsp:Transcript_167174/g.536966  ORF Transcript_167174/g.536966 Transcript_167174/m.536966 type:complete len:268 (-) Transcript_167174:826-1629(-)
MAASAFRVGAKPWYSSMPTLRLTWAVASLRCEVRSSHRRTLSLTLVSTLLPSVTASTSKGSNKAACGPVLPSPPAETLDSPAGRCGEVAEDVISSPPSSADKAKCGGKRISVHRAVSVSRNSSRSCHNSTSCSFSTSCRSSIAASRSTLLARPCSWPALEERRFIASRFSCMARRCETKSLTSFCVPSSYNWRVSFTSSMTPSISSPRLVQSWSTRTNRLSSRALVFERNCSHLATCVMTSSRWSVLHLDSNLSNLALAIFEASMLG